jgi:hypothetical protein
VTILQRLRRRRTKGLLVAGLLASLLFTATSSSASSTVFSDNFTPPHARISDHLALPSNTLATGSTETGFLVVNNRTKATINLTKKCQPEIEGILRGARYTQQSWSDLVCSAKGLGIRPGLNRLPVRFVATYLSCTQDPKRPSGMVRCVDGNKMPPLPPGTYVAHVDGGGAALPVPNTITVHLTAH